MWFHITAGRCWEPDAVNRSIKGGATISRYTGLTPDTDTGPELGRVLLTGEVGALSSNPVLTWLRSSSVRPTLQTSDVESWLLLLLLFSSFPSVLSVHLSVSTCLCPPVGVYLSVSICLCPPVCVHLSLSTCRCIPVCVHLSLSTCRCLPVCVHLSVSICLSICLCPPVSVHLSVSTCLCPPVGPPVFVYLSVYLSVHLSVSTCLCLPVCPPVCVYLSVSTCLCLPVCLLLMCPDGRSLGTDGHSGWDTFPFFRL